MCFFYCSPFCSHYPEVNTVLFFLILLLQVIDLCCSTTLLTVSHSGIFLKARGWAIDVAATVLWWHCNLRRCINLKFSALKYAKLINTSKTSMRCHGLFKICTMVNQTFFMAICVCGGWQAWHIRFSSFYSENFRARKLKVPTSRQLTVIKNVRFAMLKNPTLFSPGLLWLNRRRLSLLCFGRLASIENKEIYL